MAVQFHQLEVRELAKFPDVIWDARNSKKTVVAALQAATLEEETTLGEETALERAVAALTSTTRRIGMAARAGVEDVPQAARGAAREAARAQRLSVTSTRSSGSMPTTALAPRLAPGCETRRPGPGSSCHH